MKKLLIITVLFFTPSLLALVAGISSTLGRSGGASCFAQNNALVINGAYMKLNGGVVATPVYVVVNQPNILGITRTTGHIISESDYNYVQWNSGTTVGAFTIPFGVGAVAADYIPFTFNKTTAGAANISVSTYGTAAADNLPRAYSSPTAVTEGTLGTFTGEVIDRWWRINVSAAATADMTFSYRASENNTTSTPTDITKPQRWNGTEWDAPVGAGSAGVTTGIGTVNSGSISTFSPWILSRGAKPLPIELLSFDASCDNNKVLISWSTATEINNDYFTIERTLGNINFTAIGTVNGAGNSIQTRYYTFTDPAPLNSTSYYRLKQTDFDGKFKYFNTIHSNCNEYFDRISIYPNPSNGNFSYTISSSINTEVNIKVYDILVYQQYSYAT